MGTTIARMLTAEEQARMPLARQAMADAGAQGCATRFTFFAAFDGTNNDEGNLKLSGSELPTNISHLRGQAREAADPHLDARYYPGVGTGGDQGHLLQAAVLPTAAINAAAEKAYRDFRRAALDHLDANPEATPADLGVASAGFSRGAASAIRFAQLVHERGLSDASGQAIAPPGSVPVTAMALIDPVARFVNTPLHIPPNVQDPILSVLAEHETRTDFRPLYFKDDPRVTHVDHPGNHVGLGGGYDRQGTAASVLEGVTAFLRQRGVGIAEVPPEWRHDPLAPQPVYSEVWQVARNGQRIALEGGVPNAVWRHDEPALGRIGIVPRVPPGHAVWLAQAREALGPGLRAAGHDGATCERIAIGCVCRAAAHAPGAAGAVGAVPRFMLSRDGERIGVLHPPGDLQEMTVQQALEAQPPAQVQMPMSTAEAVIGQEQGHAIEQQLPSEQRTLGRVR